MSDWDASDDDWDNFVAPGAKPPKAVDDEEDEEVVEDDDINALESTKPKKAGDPNKIKVAQNKKKTKAQLKKEQEEAIAKEEERAKAAKAMTAEQKYEEKMRLQRLVEQSDNDLTNELFAKKADGVVDVDSIAAQLSTVSLDEEEEYLTFAKAVGKRLELEDDPVSTCEFLKELLRSACVGLTVDDIVDITKVINVIKNEKQKQKTGKKKKKPVKQFAKVNRDMFDVEETDVGNDGGYDDGYDFM